MRRKTYYNPTKLSRWEPESIKIAQKVIKCLFLGMAIPAFFASPYAGYYLIRGGISYMFRKTDFEREIKRLKKKKFVALTKTPDGWSVRLLKKGKKIQDRIAVQDLSRLPTPDKWDKKWRIYVFDIPEELRYARDLLRAKLKELGLFNVQRSVFVYPYDCRNELELISKCFRLNKYTTYAVADYIDIDRELQKYFRKILK